MMAALRKAAATGGGKNDEGDGGGGGDDGGGGGDGAHEVKLAAVERQSKGGRGTHGVIVPSPVVNPEGSKKAGGESQRFECGSRWHSGLRSTATDQIDA